MKRKFFFILGNAWHFDYTRSNDATGEWNWLPKALFNWHLIHLVSFHSFFLIEILNVHIVFEEKLTFLASI